ncbi:MAG: RecX family transcriptional regulator [Spirochaetaceae bacterium]|nr:MAG: RecX family transcriptional regulator [Spirochaetaceae bacterium]
MIEVALSDGSRFFVLAALWRRSGMEEGRPCSVAQLERLQLESEAALAEQKAVALLARREYSRSELTLRLQQRGYGETAVATVLDRLSSRGLQDDARFARAWIESRLRRRPQARRQLLLGLRARGVAAAVAGEALDAYDRDNPHWQNDALRRALERAQRGSCDGRRLAARLARLGFEPAAIRRALGRSAEGGDAAGPEDMIARTDS